MCILMLDACFSHPALESGKRILQSVGRLCGDEGPDFFSSDDADDVAGFAHTEDHHGHVVVFAEGDGCGVHDFEVETEDVVVGDLLEFGGFFVDFWIGGVDAIDRGGLEENVSFDLHGTEAGSSVGGKEGVAGAGGEDDDAALFEVAHGPATDVGLGDLVHLDGRHDTAEEAELFDGVLKSYCIDDCREHAHVVGGDAVHVDGLLGDTSEEVSSAYDDAYFAAEGVNGGDFCGYFVDKDGVDAKALACGQGFA